MSETQVTFVPSSSVTDSFTIASTLAPSVESLLTSDITNVVSLASPYISASVGTLGIGPGAVDTTVASPGSGLVTQYYEEVVGDATGTVTMPDFSPSAGGGFSGFVVIDKGPITLTGEASPNNFVVLASGTNVTDDITQGGGGVQSVYAGGTSSTLNLSGLNSSATLGSGTNTVNVLDSASGLNAFQPGGAYATIVTDGGTTNTINISGSLTSATITSGGNDLINLDSSGLGDFNNVLSVTGASVIHDAAGTSGDVINLSGTDTLYLAGDNNSVTVSGAATVYASGSGNTIASDNPLDKIINTGTGNIITGFGGNTTIAPMISTSVTLDVNGSYVTLGVDPTLHTAAQDMINGINDAEATTNAYFSAIVDTVTSGGSVPTPPSDANSIATLFVSGNTGGITSLPGSAPAVAGGSQNQFGYIVDSAQGVGTVLGGSPKNGSFIALAGANVTYDPQGGTGTESMIGMGGDHFTLDGQNSSVSLSGSYNTVLADSVSGGSTNAIMTTGQSNTVSLVGGQDTVMASGASDLVFVKSSGAAVSLSGANSAMNVLGSATSVSASLSGSGEAANIFGTTDSINGSAMTGSNAKITLFGNSDMVTMGGAGAVEVTGNRNTIVSGATVADFGTGNSISVSGAIINYEYGSNSTITASGSKYVMANGSDNTISASSGVIQGQMSGGRVVATGTAGVVLGDKNGGGTSVSISGSGNNLVSGNDTVQTSGSGFVDMASGNNSVDFTGATAIAFTSGGSDTINATGASTVFGSTADVTMKGGTSTSFNNGSGSLTFIGGSGPSVVHGGTNGNNNLAGGAGSSTLLGAGANNTLTGGSSGQNLLVAGAGGVETLTAVGGVTSMVGSTSQGGETAMTGAAGGNNTFILGAGANLVTAGATGTVPGASNTIFAGSASQNSLTVVDGWSSAGTVELGKGISVTAQATGFFGIGSAVQLSDGSTLLFVGFDKQVSTTPTSMI